MRKLLNPSQLCLLAMLAIAPGTAKAANYFVDNGAAGLDTNDGKSPDTPWKSLARLEAAMPQLQPGDVIRLRSGRIWNKANGGEVLRITRSGTTATPLVFGSYGVGASPKIENANPYSSIVELKDGASYVTIEGWKLENVSAPVTEANRGANKAGSLLARNGFFIDTSAHHNTIRNCELTQLGRGVSIKGQHNLVTQCYFHDMRGAKNTTKMQNAKTGQWELHNDDYGANGVLLEGSFNSVTYSRFVNCIAPSEDYVWDGGAVEIWASQNVDGCRIYGNYAENSDGFFETGGPGGTTTCNDLVVAYNVAVNNRGMFAYLHRGSGVHAVQMRNLRIDNNTVIEDTTDIASPRNTVIAFDGPKPTQEAPLTVLLRNNIIFAGPASAGEPRNITYASALFEANENNFFAYRGTPPATFLGGAATGKNNRIADPGFINFGAGDFRLKAGGVAIGAGVPLEYQTDAAGRAVNQPPDLGAYSFHLPTVRPAVPTAAKVSPGIRHRLDAVKLQVDRHLQQGVLAFWEQNSVDWEHGGFVTQLDRFGNRGEQTDKPLVMQARQVWTFSTAHRAGPSRPEYLLFARQGFEFLADKMWDKEHGGFYWIVTRDGTPVEDGKFLYGQEFALYSLSEYYLASGDKRALDLADKLFDLIQSKMRDGDNGYFEDFTRDWKPANFSKIAGAVERRKTFNTHLHLMEALTTYYEATRRPEVLSSLRGVMDIQAQKIIDPKTGVAMEPFDVHWKPLPDEQGRFNTSYGHNVEYAWLWLDAVDAIGESRETVRQPVLRLIDHALENGFDEQAGGLARLGPYTGRAMETPGYNGPVLLKEWWEQAELLVALAEAYRWTGEPKYLADLEREWQWVWHHQIDHEFGEWYPVVFWDGKPKELNKGSAWKASYHNGRALMRVSRILGNLLGQQ